MVFSSLIFLYVFLPLTLLILFLVKRNIQNYLLLLASWIFFAWGGVSYLSILILSTVFNYIIGLLINGSKKKGFSKAFLIFGLIGNLGTLVVFKYANFIADNLNLAISGGIETPILLKKIVLPIGISFFTFQAISYIVDLHRSKVKVQKNFFNLALYISLFPQLIAGPIVRYETIENQLKHRKTNLNNFYEGIKRFALGLAKKVLIANQMAIVADGIFSYAPEQLSGLSAWLGIIAYSFQIYFDFSGYSDMAIGLGRMFGFHFLENFNFPYISKSIKEFWRRWHISLSTWFRDYLYIPLGGSRNGKIRTYINLWIVFILTGFWHGASWNFLIWGLIHGLLLVIERLGYQKILDRIPSIFSRIYVLFFVIIAWVFFRAEDLTTSIEYIRSMFGGGDGTIALTEISEYLTKEFYTVLIIAILASTKFFQWLVKASYLAKNRFNNTGKNIIVGVHYSLSMIFILAVILLTTIYLVPESYNPFIYFRF